MFWKTLSHRFVNQNKENIFYLKIVFVECGTELGRVSARVVYELCQNNDNVTTFVIMFGIMAQIITITIKIEITSDNTPVLCIRSSGPNNGYLCQSSHYMWENKLCWHSSQKEAPMISATN